MTYTDTQLKQALAKMLPEQLVIRRESLYWQYEEIRHDRPIMNLGNRVLDTELLHLCWLVEETLTNNEADMYGLYINGIMNEAITQKFQSVCDWHATWQQRVIALAKVKGVEIV
jgi:hypothetical protein